MVWYNVRRFLEPEDTGKRGKTILKDDPEKNDQFEWYCILSDQQVSFLEMKVLEGTILACATCGKCFYFNEKGPLENVGYTDGYSCKEPLNLLGWKFK